MRDTVTTLLDALAIVVTAIGLGFLAAGWTAVVLYGPTGRTAAMIGIGLTVTGLAIGVASWLTSRPAHDTDGADQ